MANRPSLSQPCAQHFNIWDESGPPPNGRRSWTPTRPEDDVLQELSDANGQSRGDPVVAHASPHASDLAKSLFSDASAHFPRRTSRAHRPQLSSETFEPLVSVPEETSSILESDTTLKCPSRQPSETHDFKDISDQGFEILSSESIEMDIALHNQVEKHLAATRLDREMSDDSPTSGLIGLRRLSMEHLHQLPPPPYPGTPLKVPEVTALIQQAIAPSPPATTGERSSSGSSSFGDGSPSAGYVHVSRIEDSLEELDKLEDELEAVHQVTSADQLPSDAEEPSGTEHTAVKGLKLPTATKSDRASIPGHSATLRVKKLQKEQPTLRRSASLTLRDKRLSQQSPSVSRSKATSVAQGQSTFERLSTPKNPVKSTKPLTVPRFELPGEAVARRLKEQREARKAQQMEAEKAQTPASKPRLEKRLAWPTFELPGEAISRRKQEQREAKLRAEEELTRSRREFKARPVMHGIGSATFPRRAASSRARQDVVESPHVGCEIGSQSRKNAIDSLRSGVGPISNSKTSPSSRGRDPMSTPTEASRATSASLGRAVGNRNTLSLEELAMQRQRGKDILQRDRSLKEDKERDKREREMTAKRVRAEAAERSRIASREWAEKKRQAELAAKRAA
ncbi:hypothetical protein AAL_04106 [Moelleriella libera RCEF 2490]|uniref:Carboxylesterase family protein n=1 Tax=Moelleriella libera RCEF 2490 TaxID=1081109 RepID=A0A168CQ25_9HYPO|nr:hypothetical protein AAL_04106 [Moelleriella libera RCEF 2490]